MGADGAGAGLALLFGENVRLAREKAGLSQEELGFHASLHRTEISQLERGMRVPRIDTVVKLAGALRVSPGALLEGMAWTPNRAVPGGFVTNQPGEGAGLDG